MMSLSYIRELNHERAAEAAENREEPVELTEHDLIAIREHGHSAGVRIPNLGDYDPPDFERVNILEHPDFEGKATNGYGGTGDPLDDSHGVYFVDASGWGDPGEPALTLEQFTREAVPGYYYAVTSAGQFQIAVGVFERV